MRYALVGGGPGMLVGAWASKHTTLLKDKVLLSKIIIATFSIVYVLAFTFLTT